MVEINMGLRKESGIKDLKGLELGVLESLMDNGNGVLKEKELRGC